MNLDTDGAELSSTKLTVEELERLERMFEAVGDRPGLRVLDDPVALSLVSDGSSVFGIVRKLMGEQAKAVRLVLFDKTPTRNWGVAWHQDRTIAVQEKIETEGFGPWSRKQGVVHVEPPFDLLARMLTVRVHLDACPEKNSPLIVARGSHRSGLVEASMVAQTAEAMAEGICLAEPGDVWLYCTPILHTSKPAAAPKRRRVLQADFAATDLPNGLVWASA